MTDQNSINKLREEHLKNIFQLYQEKAKSSQRAFNVLYGFALVFFLIVLIPYITIKIRNTRIEIQLDELATDIPKYEKDIHAYRQALVGYQEFRNNLANAPSYLRNFILSLERTADFVPQISPQNLSAQTDVQIRPAP